MVNGKRAQALFLFICYNDYGDLMIDYENSKKINKKMKQHIVAYDVCIGKRSISNVAIDSSIDCSEVLEKQLVSLMNVSDYAKASLDADCTTVKSPACNNYNYLNGGL